MTTTAPPPATSDGPLGQAPFGVVESVATHPAVLRAAEVAERWRSDAERVDTDGLDRARVDLAAHAGLLALTAPAALGGGGHAPAVARAVTELLAGACGTTWFVTAQHALPVSVLAGADPAVAGAHLPALADGSLLAATAVSHVRRPGPPAVTAEPDGSGWRLSGTVGWLTSWGLADVMLLCATTADERLVFALLPAQEQPGLVPGPLLRTLAMAQARTTTLQLDGLRVPADLVVQVVPAAPWLARDAAKTANVVPAVFGLLGTVCRRLVEASSRPSAEDAARVALRVAGEAEDVRAEAYRLMDEVDAQEQVARRLDLRARALHLLNEAATALVAAGAGAAMSMQHPAQRLARESLFHLVQAQTGPVRAATLREWAAVGPRPGRGR